ncbi:MAG TPA: YjbQ family protein [Archaeoglobaceae archaeon]|nr:YjbQ family protein [Archaeoglobaceae archaeon]
MKIISVTLNMNEMADITSKVEEVVRESGKKEGAVLVFSIGSTGAITTIEYEPGLKKDFPRIMDRIAPYGEHYDHHLTWHDDNGSSHIKASIIGPSITVPFKDGKLLTGTWQQIVVINFDTRRRERKVAIQVLS